MDVAYPFRANPHKHEGVMPFQVWGLRVMYLLMLVFVAPTAWGVLLAHEGEWKPLNAIAWSVWATYPCLAFFGLLQPLRWLPLVFFALGYKSIWLVFVALPLWQAGTLTGATAEIAGSFAALPLLALVVPWGYAWRTYVLNRPGN